LWRVDPILSADSKESNHQEVVQLVERVKRWSSLFRCLTWGCVEGYDYPLQGKFAGSIPDSSTK
jgi:hypothetical protein